jgi:N6-adenosine-specific RNA methylase IME4
MIPFPNKKYAVIYADPPWTFKTYSAKGAEKKSAAAHYKLMSREDIQALPVQCIAADDCGLFLWATYPNLEEALELIKAWGFTYKTVAFTWVKRNRKSPGWFWGLGYWTRSNAEICLLATKGHPKRVSRSVHSVVDEPVRDHSRKPDTVRDRIVQLCGDLPRIELFARQRCAGWDAWGDEAPEEET